MQVHNKYFTIGYAITQGLFQNPNNQCQVHLNHLNHNPHPHSIYQHHQQHHHHLVLEPLSGPSLTLQTANKSLGGPNSLMPLPEAFDLL